MYSKSSQLAGLSAFQHAVHASLVQTWTLSFRLPHGSLEGADDGLSA
jgi:hypothetical protein